MAHAKIAVSPDGRRVKVKVPGEKRAVVEIPFRDKYRGRSMKALRRLLLALPSFRDVGEEPIERDFLVEYVEGGEPRASVVHIPDTALSTILSTTKNLLKLYPGLKAEYRLTFLYKGRGDFQPYLPLGLDGEESKAIMDVVDGLIQPHYQVAFHFRISAIQMQKMIEAYYAKRLPRQDLKNLLPKRLHEGAEQEAPRTSVTEEPMIAREETPEAAQPPEPAPQPIVSRIPQTVEPIPAEETVPQEEVEEEPASIEEIMRTIEGFRPSTFSERAAYLRYQQALARPWAKGKENEVHELFYRLIMGRRGPKDFERYYGRINSLVPEWLQPKIRREAGRRRDPRKKGRR